jgi:hypothetical protein
MLAGQLMQHLGAPSVEVARNAAEEEVAFAQSLCQHPLQTILAVQRDVEEDGEIRERFRTLHQREKDPHADPLHQYARAFTLVEDDSEIEEKVDLMGLMKTDRT